MLRMRIVLWVEHIIGSFVGEGKKAGFVAVKINPLKILLW
jgi:hypothetical protein